jgi:hypothetical protein
VLLAEVHRLQTENQRLVHLQEAAALQISMKEALMVLRLKSVDEQLAQSQQEAEEQCRQERLARIEEAEELKRQFGQEVQRLQSAADERLARSKQEAKEVQQQLRQERLARTEEAEQLKRQCEWVVQRLQSDSQQRLAHSQQEAEGLRRRVVALEDELEVRGTA